jgi:hypothetical protein
MTVYFFTSSILQGRSTDYALEKIKYNTKPALFNSWKLWPAANVINFTYVPIQFQVLFINFIGLFWTGYLSYAQSEAGKVEESVVTQVPRHVPHAHAEFTLAG